MKTSEKGKKPAVPEQSAKNKDINVLEIAPAAAELPAASNAKKASGSGKKRARKTKAEDKQTDVTLPAKKRSRRTPASSPVKPAKVAAPVTAETPIEPTPAIAVSETVVSDPLASMSPVDKLLAQPVLPPLERENRARLQMQSPTKLHFYWSVRENPWATLRKAFGAETGSYTLVLKLVEMRSGAEQIHNADADGDWWFDVRPDGEYRAEIGFYAPNRPYIRIVYSNVIETPRLKPSPRRASQSEWTVSATKFAKVLNVAGFARDAFDVAVAGDDPASSASAARQALRQFANGKEDRLAVINDEDIRFAMLAFAGGQKLDELRWSIQPELFDYLQSSGDELDAERAEAALREHFDLDDVEIDSEETGPAVFGASLVNFPRTARTRRRPHIGSALAPESSHSLGRRGR